MLKNIAEVDLLNHEFEKLGYVCMGEYGIRGRRFYWRSQIKRTHHIHLFEEGFSEILRHVSFKKFMIVNENYAKAYSIIKQNLAAVFSHDIESYVNGKSSFVQIIDYKTGTAKTQQLNAQDNIIIEPYNMYLAKIS